MSSVPYNFKFTQASGRSLPSYDTALPQAIEAFAEAIQAAQDTIGNDLNFRTIGRRELRLFVNRTESVSVLVADDDGMVPLYRDLIPILDAVPDIFWNTENCKTRCMQAIRLFARLDRQ